jgi:hypothetical protein
MPRGIYERPEGSGFGGFSTMSAASDAGKELAVNPTPSSSISRGKPIALAGRKLPEPHKHEEWVRQDGTP